MTRMGLERENSIGKIKEQEETSGNSNHFSLPYVGLNNFCEDSSSNSGKEELRFFSRVKGRL